MLPPWPGWDGLHPLIVHFPIGLLIVAPLFVLLALVAPKHAKGFEISALVLLALGVIAAFVAVSTGKAAGELAEHTEAINAVLERHEGLAETTRNLFAVLTVLYAALLALPSWVVRASRPAYRTSVNVVVLVLLLGGNLLLANAAHQGARLVHQFGVHAMMPAAPPAKE